MLRVTDARKSQAFFQDRLGFKTTWEHDPGDGFPVFLEVSRDAVSFHLSEHEGDGPLGIQVYVNVADAGLLSEEYGAQGVEFVEPLHDAEWGERVFVIQDPDGNLLRFGSPIPTPSPDE